MSVYVATVGLSTSSVSIALPLLKDYLDTSLEHSKGIQSVVLLPDATVVDDAKLESEIKVICKQLGLSRTAVTCLVFTASELWSHRLKKVCNHVNHLRDQDNFVVCNLTGGSKDLSCLLLEAVMTEDNWAGMVLNPNSPGGLSLAFLKDPLKHQLDQNPAFYLQDVPTIDVALAPVLKSGQVVALPSIKCNARVKRFVDSMEVRYLQIQERVFLVFQNVDRLFVVLLTTISGSDELSFWSPDRRFNQRDQILDVKQQIISLFGYNAVVLVNSLDPKRHKQQVLKERENLLASCEVSEIQASFSATISAFRASQNVPSGVGVQLEGFEAVQGKVLIALVSEQTMPVLVSLAHHQPSVLVLVSTQKMKKPLEHLKAALELWKERTQKTLKIHIEDAVDALGLQPTIKVLDLYRQSISNNQIVLNLNGGTKSMAMGAFAWARTQDEPIEIEYITGAEVAALRKDSKPSVPNQNPFNLQEVILAHGFWTKFADSMPKFDPELYEIAKDGKRRWTEFSNKWAQISGEVPNSEGLPNEYMTFHDISNVMKETQSQIVHSLKLFDFDDDRCAKSKFEADVAILHRFSLALFEAKPTLQEALSDQHRESSVQLFFAQKAGGRFAHVVVLGHQVGKDFCADPAAYQRYQDALALRGKTPEIILAVRKPSPKNPPGIDSFPKCLPHLLKDWQWLP
jgi:hypothetical protein